MFNASRKDHDCIVIPNGAEVIRGPSGWRRFGIYPLHFGRLRKNDSCLGCYSFKRDLVGTLMDSESVATLKWCGLRARPFGMTEYELPKNPKCHIADSSLRRHNSAPISHIADFSSHRPYSCICPRCINSTGTGRSTFGNTFSLSFPTRSTADNAMRVRYSV